MKTTPSVLESRDLGEQLVVLTLQFFLFAGCILLIERQFVLKLSLLFYHLLLHVSDYLDELALVHRWWVGVSSCL